MASNIEVEPGAALESGLVITDSFDNFEHMSSSLEEIKNMNAIVNSEENHIDNTNIENEEGADVSLDSGDDDLSLESDEWATKKKHIFVLSLAGKPIYSRYDLIIFILL